jgi:hypothetical protein
VLSCRQFEHAGRTGESLQDHVTTAIEGEASLAAQIANEVGRQDPPGLGSATDPAGQGDRRPEQVVVMVDRFAGGDPDPDPKFRIGGAGRACREPAWIAIEQSSALGTSSNEAMIPSPVCFTSRPRAARALAE